MKFISRVVKDLPYTLRVPSTDCFKSIALHKKINISQELAFLWITFQCHEIQLLCNLSSKTLYAQDKTNLSKCKFSDFQLVA